MAEKIEKATVFFKVQKYSDKECKVTFYRQKHGNYEELVTVDTFHKAAGAFMMGLIHGTSELIEIDDNDDLPF